MWCYTAMCSTCTYNYNKCMYSVHFLWCGHTWCTWCTWNYCSKKKRNITWRVFFRHVWGEGFAVVSTWKAWGRSSYLRTCSQWTRESRRVSTVHCMYRKAGKCYLKWCWFSSLQHYLLRSSSWGGLAWASSWNVGEISFLPSGSCREENLSLLVSIQATKISTVKYIICHRIDISISFERE